jgi:hypothetical protein
MKNEFVYLKKVVIGKKSVLICIVAYLLYNKLLIIFTVHGGGGGGRGDFILSCNMYCSIGMFLTRDITIMAPVTG